MSLPQIPEKLWIFYRFKLVLDWSDGCNSCRFLAMIRIEYGTLRQELQQRGVCVLAGVSVVGGLGVGEAP